jgi:cobalamin biosynthesis Co2+ chelatase CbiK
MMAVQGFPARVGAVESYPEVDIVINELARQNSVFQESSSSEAISLMA